MEIIIHQVKDPSSSEYTISIDGRSGYFAYSRFRDWHAVIDIVSARGIRPKINISTKKHYRFFYARFEINDAVENKQYMLNQTSRRGQLFEIIAGPDQYRIVCHKNSCYSIFKNEQQIGFLSKTNLATILDGDRYKLLIDSDADQGLMLSIALIMDQMYSGGSGIDLGFLSEERPPDLHWEPK